MMSSSVLTWLSTYQAKTITIGLVIVALCIGGYLLMDKNKKENDEFVVMRRNAKGQFQKADKNAQVSLDKDHSSREFHSFSEFSAPSEVRPEREIKRTPPMPEREVRRDPMPDTSRFDMSRMDFPREQPRVEQRMEQRIDQRLNQRIDQRVEQRVDPRIDFRRPVNSSNSSHVSRGSLSDYFTSRNSILSNGDKIRSMNDDELAEFLADVENGGLIKLWLRQKENN